MAEHRFKVYCADPINVKHKHYTKNYDKQERQYYRSVIIPKLDIISCPKCKSAYKPFMCDKCNIEYEEDNNENFICPGCNSKYDDKKSLVIAHVYTSSGWSYLTDCCKNCRFRGYGGFMMVRRMNLYDEKGNKRRTGYYKR